MKLTQRERQVLLYMREHEGTSEGELAYEQEVGYIGVRHLKKGTVLGLVAKRAISGEQIVDCKPRQVWRYRITGIGRALLREGDRKE